jgi:hypothetical protein
MARRKASLRAAPAALVEALQVVVSMTPQGPGQQTVQREMIGALGSALDARRQRIIVSEAEVNSVKWWSLYLQAIGHYAIPCSIGQKRYWARRQLFLWLLRNFRLL